MKNAIEAVQAIERYIRKELGYIQGQPIKRYTTGHHSVMVWFSNTENQHTVSQEFVDIVDAYNVFLMGKALKS